MRIYHTTKAQECLLVSVFASLLTLLWPLSLSSLRIQALSACAYAGSGITREDSVALDKVNLFERLGQDTIQQISSEFYTR